jgi:hypothetical protein
MSPQWAKLPRGSLKQINLKGYKQMNTYITEYIATLEDSIADHERALRMTDNTLLGQGHIIQFASGLAVKPLLTPINDSQKRCDGVEITQIPSAPRYDRETAERLASAIRNGVGETPRAVHIRQALEDYVITMRKLIEDIQRIEA